MIAMHRDMVSDKTDKFEGRYRMITKGGNRIWVRERSIMLRDGRGNPIAAEGVVSDITDQVQVEDALIKGRKMVGEVLQGLPAAVMVIDRDHKIVHWNRAMEKLTGIPARERIGTDLQWQPFYEDKRRVLADYIIEGDMDGMEQAYGSMKLKKSQLVAGAFESEGFLKTWEAKTATSIFSRRHDRRQGKHNRRGGDVDRPFRQAKAGGGADPAFHHRRTHRALQPAVFLRLFGQGGGTRPGATTRSWRFCFWTWIISRTSTTPTAIWKATRCCASAAPWSKAMCA